MHCTALGIGASGVGAVGASARAIADDQVTRAATPIAQVLHIRGTSTLAIHLDVIRVAAQGCGELGFSVHANASSARFNEANGAAAGFHTSRRHDYLITATRDAAIFGGIEHSRRRAAACAIRLEGKTFGANTRLTQQAQVRRARTVVAVVKDHLGVGTFFAGSRLLPVNSVFALARAFHLITAAFHAREAVAILL